MENCPDAGFRVPEDVAILGFNMGRYTGWTRDTGQRHPHGPEMAGVMKQIFAWYREGKIRPVASQCFALRDYRDAMQTVLDRRAMGKVVLRMPVAE